MDEADDSLSKPTIENSIDFTIGKLNSDNDDILLDTVIQVSALKNIKISKNLKINP